MTPDQMAVEIARLREVVANERRTDEGQVALLTDRLGPNNPFTLEAKRRLGRVTAALKGG